MSVLILASSLSMQMTVLPFSARHAPTTSPTYPVPTTAIFMSQQDTDCEEVTQGFEPRSRNRRTPCGNVPRVRVLIDYRPALRQRSGVGEYTHQLVKALLEAFPARDRKSTRLNSSHANISYAVFCL